MAESNYDAADVLMNRGLNFAGGGYGYGGGGYANHANFSHDGSVINSKLESDRWLTTQGHRSISRQIDQSADRDRDLSKALASSIAFERLSDKLNDQEKSSAANFNALQREMNANARDAAACCCALKAGQAQIIANQECTAKVSDAVANAAQNAKLDILLADNGKHGRG